MTGVDASLRAQVRAQILADYGEHTMLPGNKMPRPRRLPTGSRALDYVTGGGVPFRNITRMWGYYCLAPETKVLKSDYSWAPVGELVEGDELVGFDEEIEHNGDQRGRHRKYRRSVVLGVPRRRLPCRRVVTDKATTIASEDHLWLTRGAGGRKAKRIEWKRTADLQSGDVILWFGKPWEDLVEPDDREAAAYLGGLFDGEGHFAERCRFFFAQNEGSVLRKGLELLGKLGFQQNLRNCFHPGGCRTVCATSTIPEAMRFLSQIPAVRMRERDPHWWEGRSIMSKGSTRDPHRQAAIVLSVEDVGEQEVVAIATSTKTLIADGYFSHNSSGKTTALLKMFAAAQNYGKLRHDQLIGLAELALAGGELREAKLLKEQAKREKELGPLSIMYVCPETPDPLLAMALGVDLAKIDMVPDTVIETIGDIVQRAMSAYHVIGIDSTTATMSSSELEDPNATYGSHPMKRAQAWGVNLDWFRARMSNENCVILTSHAREKRTSSKSFAAQSVEHAPGGFALNHEPAVILHFMKGGQLKRKPDGGLQELKTDDARGSASASAFGKFQAAGGVLVVRCDKNKVGVAGRSVLLHHDKKASDFDALHEYERFAKYFRIGVNGSWWTLANGKKVQQARLALQDPGLQRQIESVVLRCAEDAEYEANLLAGRTEALVELSADSA